MSVEEAKERLASVRHSWSKAGVFMEGFKYTPAQEIVRADIQALDTILTAYEAREADSKRLDALDAQRLELSFCGDGKPIWWCDKGGVPVSGYGNAYPNVRAAIDAALSGSENTTP